MSGIPEKENNDVRYKYETGWPFGGEDFIKRMCDKVGRRFILMKPGRPKKKRE